MRGPEVEPGSPGKVELCLFPKQIDGCPIMGLRSLHRSVKNSKRLHFPFEEDVGVPLLHALVVLDPTICRRG